MILKSYLQMYVIILILPLRTMPCSHLFINVCNNIENPFVPLITKQSFPKIEIKDTGTQKLKESDSNFDERNEILTRNHSNFKGNIQSKNMLSSNQSVKNEKKKKTRAITNFNVPNGSRDIPFQNQEFGQDGHCHFVGFQHNFH